MALLEPDHEVSLDRRIEDLIEEIAAGTANERTQQAYAALSAMRARMSLPPEVREVERIVREYRRAR